MARNSKPDTVIKSSNVGGAASKKWGVAGGSVEVAWGIEGAVRADGIEYVGHSSYWAWSTYAGIGDAGWVGLLQVLILLDSYLLAMSIGREWNALDNGGDTQDGAQ